MKAISGGTVSGCSATCWWSPGQTGYSWTVTCTGPGTCEAEDDIGCFIVGSDGSGYERLCSNSGI
ncbi:hypothetical protein DIU31_024410 [Mucilaginibacter rubeus]|uniref:Uncharacterized protein n=2 Tax=Mucilaginibacter rubeus TaxID=2027860 RepID=A0AAE6JIP4_9SPHI|nr:MULTISPECIES: hypothetical protein [Mucilaginibacter]QEM06504.1 hypothetical protein DIU31_024410 [Mucilaginibacter rubeus]QEM19093.1 hypothetical protein DIU38_024675 [Mucilaginibacter gossypii]QTE44365.1 hypothetical protein J3L19_03040 [Mucilaginibacter rubeus]QTE50965.1 hypothetical protein J3L21_03015 [Mucilaginibacter rubeus]QTE56048.1 hypothetical protein J3L23_28250 [Mucilaginibacter rubeus]